MDESIVFEEQLENNQEIDLYLSDSEVREEFDSSILLEDTIELDLSSIVEEDDYFE